MSSESSELLLLYRSALNDITPHAEKVVINNLTTIAMENIDNAPIIVKAIEDHIYNAHRSIKLPLIYLMDSILKNVGKAYIPAFQKNIQTVFPKAFNDVEQREKEKLKKVLYTWKTHPGGLLFPLAVLKHLDAVVNAKPAVVQQRPQTRSQDPRYHQQQQHHNAIPNQRAIQQDINQLIAQKENLRLSQPANQILMGEISVLRQLASVVSSTSLSPETLIQIRAQISPMMGFAPSMPVIPSTSQSRPFPSSSFTPSGPPYGLSGPIGLQSTYPSIQAPVGLSSLSSMLSSSSTNPLSELLKSGITKSPLLGMNSITRSPLMGSSKIIKTDQQVPVMSKDIPKISLTASDINKVRPGLYFHLYEAIELQCKQCALRFHAGTNGSGKQLYEAHLDWHFRQNRRQKDKLKKTMSRDWYLTVDDWVAEQPIEYTTENQVAPVFFSQEAETVTEKQMTAIPASGGESKCEVCHEVLEKYFDEDQEIWMIRDAVKVGDKIYHQACHQDAPSIQGTPVLGKRTIDPEVFNEAAKKPKMAA